MAQSAEYKVGMTCSGCSDAVTRILSKLDVVDKVECDIEGKSVVVTAKEGQTLDVDVITTKLQKWGTAAQKEVAFVKSS